MGLAGHRGDAVKVRALAVPVSEETAREQTEITMGGMRWRSRGSEDESGGGSERRGNGSATGIRRAGKSGGRLRRSKRCDEGENSEEWAFHRLLACPPAALFVRVSLPALAALALPVRCGAGGWCRQRIKELIVFWRGIHETRCMEERRTRFLHHGRRRRRRSRLPSLRGSWQLGDSPPSPPLLIFRPFPLLRSPPSPRLSRHPTPHVPRRDRHSLPTALFLHNPIPRHPADKQ